MKKGFTLIELIMVIVVLGIIALIAIPIVNNIIKDSKEKAYNEQIDLIVDTARTYMSNNSLKLPSQIDGASVCITIETLQKAGLLSKNDILNPNYTEGSTDLKKQRNFNGAVKVYWQKNKYVYEYKYSDSC